MTTEINTTNGLAQKYERLPSGMVTRIASKFGLSKQYVSAVKNGAINNLPVLEELIRELEEYEAKKMELEERISKL